MSWNFDYRAADKAEAKVLLDEKVAACAGHCPDAVKTVISAAIDALPDLDDSSISVSTFGHFSDPQYRSTSNMNIKVENHFNPAQT